MASSLINLAPLVATMTGSITIFFALYSVNLSAMTSISSLDETMPVLTASGRISVKIQSSCSAKNFGVTSIISVTPVVFWAVSAVIALMAYTPFAVMVLISAWMPAPPLESLPAIVNAVFILFSFALILLRDERWCPQFTACTLRVPVTYRNLQVPEACVFRLQYLCMQKSR